MQYDADAIICRPTPGDHLEQMKGRVDRPGQAAKELILVVLMAEHTLEEARFANIRLAGNFFREYIAPVATRYRERIDLEAMLAASGTQQLKRFTVLDQWRRALDEAGQSGAFARVQGESVAQSSHADDDEEEEEEEAKATEDDDGELPKKRARAGAAKAAAGGGKAKSPAKGKRKAGGDDGSDGDYVEEEEEEEEEVEVKYKARNTVLRNKGDPEAVRQAKAAAKAGRASLAVRRWLDAPKAKAKGTKGKAKDSLLRFSDATPPVVLTRDVIKQAIEHLSKADPKLEALIVRVGADALENDIGCVRPPSEVRLFDKCVRAVTFVMVSMDAGNSFLRRLAIKIGVAIEQLEPSARCTLLNRALAEMHAASEMMKLASGEQLLQKLLGGSTEIPFTPPLLGALVDTCDVLHGKRRGWPHLCGGSQKCGKNDDPADFLRHARAQAAGEAVEASAGYSYPKADQLIGILDAFKKRAISGEKIAAASDRAAMKMLTALPGIGDWSAGGILQTFLKRADLLLYGDLTVRNYLNDLYDISHNEESETLLQSSADFADTGANRDAIDAVAEANGWMPYRSVVCSAGLEPAISRLCAIR